MGKSSAVWRMAPTCQTSDRLAWWSPQDWLAWRANDGVWSLLETGCGWCSRFTGTRFINLLSLNVCKVKRKQEFNRFHQKMSKMTKLLFAYVKFRDDNEYAVVETKDIKNWCQETHGPNKLNWVLRVRPSSSGSGSSSTSDDVQVNGAGDSEITDFYKAQILLLAGEFSICSL